MNPHKKLFAGLALTLGLGTSAHAGIPVIDASNLAQAVAQVQAWAQQYQQMVQQLKQAQRQYTALSGIRNMGDLVNNPTARRYLPAEYSTILSQGVGQWAAIRNASMKFDVASTSLSASSDAAQSFNQVAKQAAINRATAEAAYATASQRFDDIQVLLDRVNAAPDPKDMADLQGRIQAEQVMMQNEANKLQMLQQLASAQRDLQVQQAREISMKSSKGDMPTGW
jgi:type IV secretion system protein VirB5